jgi:Calcineurin-like phosphoesterase
MQNAPQTFRDHLLSIYQSAAERHARETTQPAATAPGLENPLISAVARISALRAQGAAAIPEIAPLGMSGQAWTCARLGLALLEASATGDQAAVAHIQDELKDSPCDPGWAATLIEYGKYFGADGTRRSIPYITPDKAGEWVVEIPNNARIALIGDWGTGTQDAIALLRQVKQQNPDILVHLGDIYYSGTADECDQHFRQIVDEVFDRSNTHLPVFTMAGNHDMYSGGDGYYALIGALNQPPRQQKSSFFCLRSENKAWQLLAMDTGLHDYDPLTVTDALTFVDAAEEAWHIRRIKELGTGQTILLSHHQLYSAFSQIGPERPDGSFNACNPSLLTSLEKFSAAGKIAAWFWGHEHMLNIYQPYAGLNKGRCVGHGAIPVLTSTDPYTALAKITNPPALLKATQLSVDDAIYTHGFAMISLDPDGGPASAEYHQSSAAGTPMYTETLG